MQYRSLYIVVRKALYRIQGLGFIGLKVKDSGF